MPTEAWLPFWLAVGSAALYLYVPGYLFFRGLHFAPSLAFCCAPLFSAACCAALPIAYYELGISCDILTIAGPTLIVALVAFLLGRIRKGKEDLALPPLEPIRVGHLRIPCNVCMIVAYVVVGALVCHYVFTSNLPAPYVVNAQFDNQTHINTIRSFIDTGKWSTLHKDYYATSAANERPYRVSDEFYPCGWHDLTAIACLIARADVATAINASVVVMAVFMSPLGFFVLIRALFPQARRTAMLGSIAASGFSSWPWVYVNRGPRYPNMYGLVLMIAALAIVILFVEQGQVKKRPLTFCLFCLMSLFGLAIAHPNTLFTAYIILAPYGAHVIWRGLKERHVAMRVVVLVLYVAVLLGFWYLCYQLPPLQGVLEYRWNEDSGVLRTFSSLLGLRLRETNVQVVMCVALLLGIVALVKQKMTWPLWSLAFFSLCFVATRMGWETLKYWLAGMWYQSPDRFAACISVWSIPIAALGLDSLLSWVGQRFAADDANADKGKHLRQKAPASFAARHATAIVFTVLCIVNFMPAFTVPLLGGFDVVTAYGNTIDRIQGKVSQELPQVYDLEEMAFVDKVTQVVPHDALVINQPNDGTMFSYGANGLKTYFRTYQGSSTQVDAAQEIREHLDEYATNKEVQKAVDHTGAEYLLLLDMGAKYPNDEDALEQWMYQYRDKKMWDKWSGINDINDATPGLETVLAEGDEMRLFRFVDDK